MNATRRVAWAGLESRTEISFDWRREQFDLFVTSDQNLRYQQNLESRRIAIVELSTNNLRRLERAAALLCLAVANMRAGEFRRLEIE